MESAVHPAQAHAPREAERTMRGIARMAEDVFAESKMSDPHPNDPLHGITLEEIITHLVDHFGWEELGKMVPIRCFQFDPSIRSSLKFLRKTPWARKKVEDLFLWSRPDRAP
jgi:uncharacterized protein (DUF2132 family)